MLAPSVFRFSLTNAVISFCVVFGVCFLIIESVVVW